MEPTSSNQAKVSPYFIVDFLFLPPLLLIFFLDTAVNIHVQHSSARLNVHDEIVPSGAVEWHRQMCHVERNR